MTKSFIFFITIRADFDEFDEKQFRGGKQTKQKNRPSSTKEPDRKTYYFD